MLELNRELVYGIFDKEDEKVNNLFETLILENNPNGVKLVLDFNHKAVVYKTNVKGVTLVEEYFPNRSEKLWVNKYENKEIMLPRASQELIQIARECDSRNLYKFNYMRDGNITYSLTNNRKILVRETKLEDNSLSIDLFYLGDLLA